MKILSNSIVMQQSTVGLVINSTDMSGLVKGLSHVKVIHTSPKRINQYDEKRSSLSARLHYQVCVLIQSHWYEPITIITKVISPCHLAVSCRYTFTWMLVNPSKRNKFGLQYTLHWCLRWAIVDIWPAVMRNHCIDNQRDPRNSCC